MVEIKNKAEIALENKHSFVSIREILYNNQERFTLGNEIAYA